MESTTAAKSSSTRSTPWPICLAVTCIAFGGLIIYAYISAETGPILLSKYHSLKHETDTGILNKYLDNNHNRMESRVRNSKHTLVIITTIIIIAQLQMNRFKKQNKQNKQNEKY